MACLLRPLLCNLQVPIHYLPPFLSWFSDSPPTVHFQLHDYFYSISTLHPFNMPKPFQSVLPNHLRNVNKAKSTSNSSEDLNLREIPNTPSIGPELQFLLWFYCYYFYVVNKNGIISVICYIYRKTQLLRKN